MLTALFYYSLVVLLIIAIAASVCLSGYFVSRRRSFLYAMISFLFYFFDVSLPFSHTFVTPEAVLEAKSFWDVGDPVLSVIFGGGALLFLWLAACQYVGKGGPLIRFGPVVVFVVASAVLFRVIETPPVARVPVLQHEVALHTLLPGGAGRVALYLQGLSHPRYFE